MRIGILDSGLGGLTVAREVRAHLPGCDVIYWGDTARMPYGGRHADTIRAYAAQGADVLVKAGAEVMIVACHTIAAVAAADLSERLDIPIFSIMDAAVEAAVATSRKERFGVIATRATVESGAYEEKICRKRPNAKIYTAAAPLLVSLVEEAWIKKPETHRIVKNYLHPLKIRQIDTLIPGCTQLLLLKKTLSRKAGTRIAVIDAVLPLVLKIRQFIERDANGTPGRGGTLRVLVSEKTTHLENTARFFFNGNVVLEKGPLLL